MKTKTEQCKQIKIYPSVKLLLSSGVGKVSWGDGFDIYLRYERIGRAGCIWFICSIRNEQGNIINNYEYKVRLTRTKCYIAGWRYWFICPLEACGRRVRVLYKPPDEKYFGCRHCHNLIYRSQCLSGLDKKYGKIISNIDLQEKEYSFKKRFHGGLPTRRYSAFNRKVVKNYFGIQKRTEYLRKMLTSK